ncbi:hypothetical protein Trydic_g23696 [Trypoxylus dichotomus]
MFAFDDVTSLEFDNPAELHDAQFLEELAENEEDNLKIRHVFLMKVEPENGCKNVANWKDIEKAYMIDNYSGELRLMPKLTDFHIDPKMIKKTKVAAVINLLSTSGTTSKDSFKLGSGAVGTTKVFKLLDNLFDSVNGTLHYPKGETVLRVAISRYFPHFTYWTLIKFPYRTTLDSKCYQVSKNLIQSVSVAETSYKLYTGILEKQLRV